MTKRLSVCRERKRSPLNIAVSDDGINRTECLVLESSPIKEYSYPSLIQGKDGLVYIHLA